MDLICCNRESSISLGFSIKVIFNLILPAFVLLHLIPLVRELSLFLLNSKPPDLFLKSINWLPLINKSLTLHQQRLVLIYHSPFKKKPLVFINFIVLIQNSDATKHFCWNVISKLFQGIVIILIILLLLQALLII